mmetsp:Transcript_3995/g.9487  ORF Transcript_3995/g.9487 Transcript_3995/m.9487 type:complete len:499 (-) Transcript_3995:162-1658(-)
MCAGQATARLGTTATEELSEEDGELDERGGGKEVKYGGLKLDDRNTAKSLRSRLHVGGPSGERWSVLTGEGDDVAAREEREKARRLAAERRRARNGKAMSDSLTNAAAVAKRGQLMDAMRLHEERLAIRRAQGAGARDLKGKKVHVDPMTWRPSTAVRSSPDWSVEDLWGEPSTWGTLSPAQQRRAARETAQLHQRRRARLGQDTGAWDGVAVIDGRIMSLNLSRGQPPLPGRLERAAPNLGLLTGLARLNLSGNHLSGPIPAQALARLFGLSHLNLGSNHLTGPVPLELTQLRSLKELKLNCNQLSGGLSPQLGFGFPDLALLDLSANQLRGEFPEQLSSLRKLKVLNLSRNAFTGWLHKWVGWLGECNTLKLNHNKLGGGLPPELNRLRCVEYLHLHSNQFDGELDISKTFEAMNPDLRELYLQGNKFYDELAQEAAASFLSAQSGSGDEESRGGGGKKAAAEEEEAETRTETRASALAGVKKELEHLFAHATILL